MRCTAYADDSKEEFNMSAKSKMTTKQLTMAAILTALVIVLQLVASGLARASLFPLCLVLVPIVIGAATCGIGISTWLGFVFGVVVLISDPSAHFFMFTLNNIPGTIVTVLAKGILCGFEAGVVYKAFENRSKNIAVFSSAIASAVTNTGVFLIGCLFFFTDYVISGADGGSVGIHILTGFIGLNFPIELAINLVLSPVILRLLKIRENK